MYDSLIGDFPARSELKFDETVGLFGGEEGERHVGHVIRLKVELDEIGKQLGDGAQRVVGDIYAVGDRQRRQTPTRLETLPKAGFRDFVTSCEMERLRMFKYGYKIRCQNSPS